MKRFTLAAVLCVVAAILVAPTTLADAPQPWTKPVDKAECGAGSSPETGLQGQVSATDRATGRSMQGYRCNLALVGQAPGEGASWQMAWYGDCAYYDQARTIPGGTAGNNVPIDVTHMVPSRPTLMHPGTVVVDASDPAHPKPSTYLTTNSMMDAWESLKVNDRRGLLAAVEDGGPGFSIYDVSADCRHPHLDADVNLTMAGTKGHAGNFAPDGLTYYGSDLPNGFLNPVDVSDPTKPTQLAHWSYPSGGPIHDVSTSEDGSRTYLAFVPGNGLVITDTSEIQSRKANPDIKVVSQFFWTDGSEAQQTLPLTIGGRPHIMFTDEAGRGGARILDISDEMHPKLVAKLMLEIDDPANSNAATADEATDPPGTAGMFGYQGHYCNVDTVVEPTILVCSYFQSGLRVFDIRNVFHPREIAYYNPPAKPGYVPGSNYSRTGLGGLADWTTAQPRIVKSTGELWFTSQQNGFQIVKFANGVWPFRPRNVAAEAVIAAESPRPGIPNTGAPPPATVLVWLGAAAAALVAGRRRRAVRPR